jgi:hypothetical protein
VIRWVGDVEKEIGQEVGCLDVDYVDRVAWPGRDRDVHPSKKQEQVAEAFQVWGKNNGRWVFSACQATNQKKYGKKELTSGPLTTDDCGWSLGKMQIADTVISLNYIGEGKRQLKPFVAKCRYGRDLVSLAAFQTQFPVGRLCAIPASLFQPSPTDVDDRKPIDTPFASKAKRALKCEELPF